MSDKENNGKEALKKSKSFEEILFELAKSPKSKDDARNIFNEFKELFSDNEKDKNYDRQIPYIIKQIVDNKERGDFDCFANNIEYLKMCKDQISYSGIDYYNTDKNVNIGENIRKLLNDLYYYVKLQQFDDRFEYLDKKSKEIEEKSKDAEEKSKVVGEKMVNAQREYIAILGIFASIVITFNAGAIYSSSVLENIAAVGIYRLLTVSIVIGMVLINLLFGLFYYINLLVNRKRNIWPLGISNVVFLILLGIVVVCWYSGRVEARNDRIIKNEKVLPAKPKNDVKEENRPEDKPALKSDGVP